MSSSWIQDSSSNLTSLVIFLEAILRCIKFEKLLEDVGDSTTFSSSLRSIGPILPLLGVTTKAENFDIKVF